MNFRILLFFFLGLACLFGLASPPLALALGIALALTVGAPFPAQAQKISKWLLQASVVGLGFGMNLTQMMAAGRTGFALTVTTIFGTLSLGYVVGRLLRVETVTSLLVSSGTAICGGSAIAAAGSVLNADKKAMSVALGTVFVLNAIALFAFPPIGHALGLTQEQFGLWSAIAIHDTSSVVGAASKFGETALQIATTVKLGRALWIVPLTLILALINRRPGVKVTLPWFILFFILTAALRTFFPAGENIYGLIKDAAKHGLTLTLFLIGCGLSREAIRSVGPRVMIQGLILWIVISFAGLAAVKMLG